MTTISAVILTKNNAQNIEQLVTSLSWCDEVIVIDDQSTDDTKQKAEQQGARVIVHGLASDFAAQRNIALQKSVSEWVFYVDSDETVSKDLAQEIQSTIKKTTCDGFFLKRKDHIFGKDIQFGETASVRLLRLGKRTSGLWVGKVHEVWKSTGEKGTLVSPLIHYPHQSIQEFLHEINMYSTMVAEERYATGKQVHVLEIITFPVGKFVQNYLLRQGFRDGMPGLILAMMMSFHSFLVRGKLYMLHKKVNIPDS